MIKPTKARNDSSHFVSKRWTDRLGIYKAVTIYQIRWSIEVYFKETSSTRAWRKEQANDFDAQIANSSIIMVQYILLTFQKRFRD